MKKTLLLLSILATSFAGNSQVVVAGVSPASIEGTYAYSHQANEDGWPNETDDGSWSLALDFNISGTFIQDTLMLVEDGTPGTNAQGNPVSQQGCSPLINDLTGKIAVVFRNSCDYATKALNAQNAGAIGVLVINREGGVAPLGSNPLGNGPSVTIPVVMVSLSDGISIVTEMGNGPVVMFIGNKQGSFNNDVGALSNEILISGNGGASNLIYDGFNPGLNVYNYGANDQLNVMVNAKIDGGGGNVYDQTVGPLNMFSGDTVSIFPGNTESFPDWQLGIGNYIDDDYILTYTITLGIPDDSGFDNVFTSNFKIQADQISLSRLDGSNMPIADTYPSDGTTEYQSCMVYQEPNNPNSIAAQGLYFIPHTDTSINNWAAIQVRVRAYYWEDTWVDLNDPLYTFDPTTNDAFQILNPITSGVHILASNDDVDDVAYADFQNPFLLINTFRYLFCVSTVDPAIISFGYDSQIKYDGNISFSNQPVSPILIDTSWYIGGWNDVSAPSIALRTVDFWNGTDESSLNSLQIFPNPTNDLVTIELPESSSSVINILSVDGQVVYSETIDYVSANKTIDISELSQGIYIVKVSTDDGSVYSSRLLKR